MQLSVGEGGGEGYQVWLPHGFTHAQEGVGGSSSHHEVVGGLYGSYGVRTRQVGGHVGLQASDHRAHKVWPKPARARIWFPNWQKSIMLGHCGRHSGNPNRWTACDPLGGVIAVCGGGIGLLTIPAFFDAICRAILAASTSKLALP